MVDGRAAAATDFKFTIRSPIVSINHLDEKGGPDGPGLQLGTPPRSDHGGPENRTDMLPARHAPDFER